MKRFGMTMAALLMCAVVCFAQKPALSKKPFVVKTSQLARYLQLSPSQQEEVASINAYFIEMQEAGSRASAKRREKKMQDALYGNLKLMKRALTPDQYRKYLMLLNVTNNNNRALGMDALPDVYLAENVAK